MATTPELLANLSSYPLDSVALAQGSARMTYGELDIRVDRLAGHFRQLGVVPGETVAICLERSFHWIIAALAAMRAGAAYLPMDLAWPDERLRFVAAASGATVLVSNAGLLGRLSLGIPGIDPCRDSELIASAPACEPAEITDHDLAYVIYTSGSTGVPKGVEITHGNLAHLIAWHCEAFAVTSADRGSHLAGLAFDAAAWEIWPYLAIGASVSLVDEAVRSSPEMLQRWFIEEQITVGFVPTALAGPMAAMSWPEHTNLRYLLTGGDTLHKGPATGLPFILMNNYGPTECSVVATSGIVPNGLNTVPTIGSPIKGTSIYILDEQDNPTPMGEVGEICIGGDGVGRGYRNLPKLTALSFAPDPFSAIAGARMYRTGDRGVLLPDGQISFRGRLDGQEKIRGQRIELDEISSVLNEHPSVAFGVVLAKADDKGEKYLIAYVMPAERTTPSSLELQEFLSKTLPAYMIPAMFVRLDSIPLTPNGKLDRSALLPPTPENSLSKDSVRELLSPTEEILISMVRELLRTDEVTIQADFFLIGGHSLLGTQLVLRIRRAFGIEFTLRDLFEAATVERLALRIESMLIAELRGLTEKDAMRQTGN